MVYSKSKKKDQPDSIQGSGSNANAKSIVSKADSSNRVGKRTKLTLLSAVLAAPVLALAGAAMVSSSRTNTLPGGEPNLHNESLSEASSKSAPGSDALSDKSSEKTNDQSDTNANSSASVSASITSSSSVSDPANGSSTRVIVNGKEIVVPEEGRNKESIESNGGDTDIEIKTKSSGNSNTLSISVSSSSEGDSD